MTKGEPAAVDALDRWLSHLDHASRAADTSRYRKFGFTLISRRGGVVVYTRQRAEPDAIVTVLGLVERESMLRC